MGVRSQSPYISPIVDVGRPQSSRENNAAMIQRAVNEAAANRGAVLLTGNYETDRPIYYDDACSGVCIDGLSQYDTKIIYNGNGAAIDFRNGGNRSAAIFANRFTNFGIVLETEGATGLWLAGNRDGLVEDIWTVFRAKHQTGIVVDGTRREFGASGYGSWRNVINRVMWNARETRAGGPGPDVAINDLWSCVGVKMIGGLEVAITDTTGSVSKDHRVLGLLSGATGYVLSVRGGGTQLIINVDGRRHYISGEPYITSTGATGTLTFTEMATRQYGGGNEVVMSECKMIWGGAVALNIIGNQCRLEGGMYEAIRCPAIQLWGGMYDSVYYPHEEPSGTVDWRTRGCWLNAIGSTRKYLDDGEIISFTDGASKVGSAQVTYWEGKVRYVELVMLTDGVDIAVGDIITATDFSAVVSLRDTKDITTVMGSQTIGCRVVGEQDGRANLRTFSATSNGEFYNANGVVTHIIARPQDVTYTSATARVFTVYDGIIPYLVLSYTGEIQASITGSAAGNQFIPIVPFQKLTTDATPTTIFTSRGLDPLTTGSFLAQITAGSGASKGCVFIKAGRFSVNNVGTVTVTAGDIYVDRADASMDIAFASNNGKFDIVATGVDVTDIDWRGMIQYINVNKSIPDPT